MLPPHSKLAVSRLPIIFYWQTEFKGMDALISVKLSNETAKIFFFARKRGFGKKFDTFGKF